MTLHPGRRAVSLATSSVSTIGLGTWQFSGASGTLAGHWEPLPQAEVNEVVRAAIEEGIDWFDTAEAYGDGASERALTSALSELGVEPGSVFIADKWWPKQRSAAHLVESIEERLACLQGYPIDLYQIHWPESTSWLRTEMKALAELQDAGKVGSVGVCNYSEKLLRKSYRLLHRQSVRLASNQVRYSLLHRGPDLNGVISAAKDLGIRVIAWSPLEQGLLTGRFHRDESAIERVSAGRRGMLRLGPEILERTRPLIEALERIGDAHDATAAQVSLAWLLQFNGDTVLAIPGASRTDQVRSNAAAMAIRLSDDELEELDVLSRRATGI
jgi:aryl-alcohol dehydrogenase-like predicted oxidoreductase